MTPDYLSGANGRGESPGVFCLWNSLVMLGMGCLLGRLLR